MGPARSVAFFGVICSILKVSAVRNGLPAGAPDNDILLNQDVDNDNAINRLTMVAANCGRMIIRDGLDVGESVKVSFTGWNDEDNDITVSLVAESNLQADRIERAEKVVKSIMETGEKHIPLTREAQIEEGAGSGLGEGLEHPAVPIVGVVIPGKSSNGGKPTILEYGSGPGNPSTTTIESEAGPETPIMIIFKMNTNAEMKVTISTWIQNAEGSEVSGNWHVAETVVGIHKSSRDVAVHVSDVGPKTLKIYASTTANLLTAQHGKCDQSGIPLMSIKPSQNNQRDSNKENVPEVVEGGHHEVPGTVEDDLEGGGSESEA